MERAEQLDRQYGRNPDLAALPMYCAVFSLKDWYDAKDRQLTEEKSRDRAFRSADQPAQKPQPLKKMMEKAAKRATTSDAKTATPSDTVKVLFVLTPNNATPSAPAATPPK